MKKRTFLTPIALAAALLTGAAHAQGPVGESRLVTAVTGVTQSLGLQAGDRGGDRAVGNRLSRERSAMRTNESANGSRLGVAQRERAQTSLPGLASADRALNRAEERQAATGPMTVGLELGGDADGRSGLKVAHQTTLHNRTAERDSDLADIGDADDDSTRTGLQTRTALSLRNARENADGDREQVDNGFESAASLSRHRSEDDPQDRDAAYSTAHLGNIASRTTDDTSDSGIGDVTGDDENTRRIGGTLAYDSRSGARFEPANSRDE